MFVSVLTTARVYMPLTPDVCATTFVAKDAPTMYVWMRFRSASVSATTLTYIAVGGGGDGLGGGGEGDGGGGVTRAVNT